MFERFTQSNARDRAGKENALKSIGRSKELNNKEQSHGGDPAGNENGSKSNGLLKAICNKLVEE